MWRLPCTPPAAAPKKTRPKPWRKEGGQSTGSPVSASKPVMAAAPPSITAFTRAPVGEKASEGLRAPAARGEPGSRSAMARGGHVMKTILGAGSRCRPLQRHVHSCVQAQQPLHPRTRGVVPIHKVLAQQQRGARHNGGRHRGALQRKKRVCKRASGLDGAWQVARLSSQPKHTTRRQPRAHPHMYRWAVASWRPPLPPPLSTPTHRHGLQFAVVSTAVANLGGGDSAGGNHVGLHTAVGGGPCTQAKQ
jgi:hypothetical protein